MLVIIITLPKVKYILKPMTEAVGNLAKNSHFISDIGLKLYQRNIDDNGILVAETWQAMNTVYERKVLNIIIKGTNLYCKSPSTVRNSRDVQ
jgi:hypothetical protein